MALQAMKRLSTPSAK